MDLCERCGTITGVTAPRWLAALSLAFAVIFAGVAPASAQVFKPRGGSKGKAPAKKAAAPKAKGGTTAKRTTTAKPAPKAAKGKGKVASKDDKVAEEDDYVEIFDDDE